LFRVGNEFDALVARIDGRCGLGRHDRKNFNTFHVLLDICAIDVADDWSARNERCVKYAFRQFGASRTPRCHVAVQACDFNLNTT